MVFQSNSKSEPEERGRSSGLLFARLRKMKMNQLTTGGCWYPHFEQRFIIAVLQAGDLV